jgi:hypothetical protein
LLRCYSGSRVKVDLVHVCLFRLQILIFKYIWSLLELENPVSRSTPIPRMSFLPASADYQLQYDHYIRPPGENNLVVDSVLLLRGRLVDSPFLLGSRPR